MTSFEGTAGRLRASPSPIFNKRVIGFFAILFVIEFFLYFRHAAHFFQADSIFLLYYRKTSLIDVLQQFISLHRSGWYRPLANDVFEAALFPVLGLSPVGYRIPVYAFFIANTMATYALVLAITRKELAAVIGTFFFAVHTVGGFVTFDLGFLPDLMYSFFYLLAVLAYVKYVEHGKKSRLWLSVACFVASLLSKEAAVTLPGVLFFVYLLMSPKQEPFGQRVLSSIKAFSVHVLVLVIYLVFVVGYLNVQNVSRITTLQRPEVPVGGYRLALDDTILINADVAVTWAMNIPRGYMGEWRQLTPGMLTFLKVFRAILVLLMIFLLIGRDRSKAAFGIAWFFLALVPSLPLVEHLLPNYLLLPLAGISIVVGLAFAQVPDAVRRFKPAAALSVVALFAGLVYVCNHGIQNDIRENRLLGGSAEIASTSLNGLKRMYPTLPPDATLFFEDLEEPLTWEHSWGALLKMAYNKEDISALYASGGHALGPDARAVEKTFLLRYHNKQLIDETAALRANPMAYLIRYTDSDVNKLSVSESEIVSGESYTISVSGLRSMTVRIAYTIDDGSIDFFTADLDARGQAEFKISAATKKGTYRFLGFNFANHSEWFRSNATLIVR